MQRSRKNYPNEKLAIEIKKELGSGSFGAVNEIEESTASGLKKTQKKVIKRFEECTDDLASLEEMAQREYVLSPAHLHAKKPFQYNGKWYMVMRKMPGETLESIIQKLDKDEINLPLLQCVRLALALLRALKTQAHDQGFIHRDLKPENILVDLTDVDNPVVNLIDFSLGRRIGSPDGYAKGSILFGAPEVFIGKGDRGADIYSFGIILIHLFCFYPTNDDDKKLYREILRAAGGCRANSHRLKMRPAFFYKKNELAWLIGEIAAYNVAERADYERSLFMLNNFRHNLKAEQLNVDVDLLVRAHIQAKRFQDILAKKTINEIQTLFQCVVMPTSTVALDEFLETLNLRSLKGCLSQSEVMQRISSIKMKYDLYCQALERLKKSQPVVAERKLRKYAENNCRSLDDYDAVCKSLWVKTNTAVINLSNHEDHYKALLLNTLATLLVTHNKDQVNVVQASFRFFKNGVRGHFLENICAELRKEGASPLKALYEVLTSSIGQEGPHSFKYDLIVELFCRKVPEGVAPLALQCDEDPSVITIQFFIAVVKEELAKKAQQSLPAPSATL